MTTPKNTRDLKPIVQTDRYGKTVTVIPNGNNTMITIEPKKINTVSEEQNGQQISFSC